MLQSFFKKYGYISEHILESYGSVRYYCKWAHLDLLFKKSLSNTSVLKKKGTFFIIITWAASNNQLLIRSGIVPVFILINVTVMHGNPLQIAPNHAKLKENT